MIRGAAHGLIDMASVERMVRWSIRDRLAKGPGEELASRWYLEADAGASWVVARLGATTLFVPDRPALGSLDSYWLTSEHGVCHGLPIVPHRKTAAALNVDRVDLQVAFDVPILQVMGVEGVRRAVRWKHPWGHDAVAYEVDGEDKPVPNPKLGNTRVEQPLGLGWLWWWSGL